MPGFGWFFGLTCCAQLVFAQMKDSASVPATPNLTSLSTDTTKHTDKSHLSFELFHLRQLNIRYSGDSGIFRQTLTHNELMRYYHGDFADLLWTVAGIYIHDPGSFGKPITASARGLPNTYLTILYDGIPVQEPELRWLNLNLISLEDIDRIEITHGLPAAICGSAGVTIDIIPKKPKDGEAISTIKFRSVFSDYQDIGAFFGRTIAQRWMFTIGGSHRETPGEQRYQQLSGGYLTSIQETRYTGNTIFGTLRYLLYPNWIVAYRYQTLNEKYDAYGPNRNGSFLPYLFRTSGGLRKDERTDHRLWTDYAGQTNYFRSSLEKTEVTRQSVNFSKALVPKLYSVRLYTHHTEYGQMTGPHLWVIALSAEAYRGDSLPGTIRQQTHYKLSFSDRIRFGNKELTGLIGYSGHSRYPGRLNALLSFGFSPVHSVRWEVTGNLIHRYPTPLEETRPPQFFTPLPFRRPEQIFTVNSDLFCKNQIGLDQIRLSVYANRFRHAIAFRTHHFLTDSMLLQPYPAKLRNNTGLDLEIRQRYLFFTFILQQSLIAGSENSLHGIPAYRAHWIGLAEHDFFDHHLRLDGSLSVKYFSRHPGYSFQDAPMRYYSVSRHSSGGFLFNTRVTATVGDFKLFYEAENIFRARFTMLDGYDVTPQQWRFGLIWTLYN